MMKYRYRRHLDGLLLITILAAQLVACGSRPPRNTAPAYTLEIRSLYPEALRLAKEWKEDAQFIDVSVDFSTLENDPGLGAFFSFRSPSSPETVLFVEYELSTDSFSAKWLPGATITSERFPEISESDWGIGSTTALEIAQAHGGSRFLAEQSASDLHLYMRLEKRKEDDQLQTVWFVAYYANMEVQPLHIVINALSGEVMGQNPTG